MALLCAINQMQVKGRATLTLDVQSATFVPLFSVQVTAKFNLVGEVVARLCFDV